MKTLTTNAGRTLKISSNQSKRHFTIRTESGTYRTYQMSREEFEQNKHNTANDWQHFLNSDDYYKVR